MFRLVYSAFKIGSFRRLSGTTKIISDVPGVLFEHATQDHVETINTLLRESFFMDEPVTKALGLTGKVDPKFIAGEAQIVLKGYSIVAIEENSCQIIAAAINKPSYPQEEQEEAAVIDHTACPNTQKLKHFWRHLTLKPNIFKLFDVDQYIEVNYLVTTPAARGKRLAEKLTRASLQLATDKGQRLAVMVCTNVASTRIAMKVDMRVIGVHCISNYFSGEDLLKLIHLTHPNDKVYVFAKVLQPQRNG